MKEIALHIQDIAENCINAGADRVVISIFDDAETGLRDIRIDDNGKGMSEVELKKAVDPFYTSRSTRRVGLGIPLFRQHAEMTGGDLTIASLEGEGTEIAASFHPQHPDCQPMGDLEGSWLLLVSSNPGIEWELDFRTKNGAFSISTTEIKEELDIKLIRGNELIRDLKRMIRNNLDALEIR